MKEGKSGKKSALLKILDSLISISILILALRIVGKAVENIDNGLTPGALFLALAAFEAIQPIRQGIAVKLEFYRRILNAAVFLFTAVMLLIREPDTDALNLAGLLYAITLVLGRICSVCRNHRARNIVLNAVAVILIFIFFYMANLRFLVANILLIVSPLVHIATVAFSQLKLSLLKKIVRKTYALEILFGMLLLIISFSILLASTEPNIENFTDGLWYCFAIVTTIGFGDITAVTALGRVLSVILGIYGIIVVSVITSVIVNFYSEVKDEKDDPEAGNEKEEPEVKDEKKDEDVCAP